MERHTCVVGGWALRLAGIAGVAGLACGGCARSDLTVEPGLANAPTLPPDTAAIESSPPIRDVVANGNDSCPRGRVASGDPLRYRFPACAGLHEARPSVPSLVGVGAPLPSPEPAALWNVHLHGLPPCSGSNERSKELAMTVCATDAF